MMIITHGLKHGAVRCSNALICWLRAGSCHSCAEDHLHFVNSFRRLQLEAQNNWCYTDAEERSISGKLFVYGSLLLLLSWSLSVMGTRCKHVVKQPKTFTFGQTFFGYF